MRLRNEQQLKVRQPLSTLYVCCDSETANKIGVFEKIILDELNIKNIKYIDDVNVLEDKYLTVNFKVAGAVLKQNVNKMKQTLGSLSKDDMTKLVSAVEQGDEVSVPGWDDKFAADIFSVQTKLKRVLYLPSFRMIRALWRWIPCLPTNSLKRAWYVIR